MLGGKKVTLSLCDSPSSLIAWKISPTWNATAGSGGKGLPYREKGTAMDT